MASDTPPTALPEVHASGTAAVAIATEPTPPGGGTPAQQVVMVLQSLVPQQAGQSSRAPVGAAPTAASASPTAAAANLAGTKTITIELNPGHLGPVSVTVRMKADALDIQIAVSSPQALQLLERDRHLLSAAVEAMGGTAGSLHLGGAAVSSDGNPASSQSFTPQGQGGFSRQDGSSDAALAGRGRHNGSAAPQTASQSDSDDPISAQPAAPTRSRDGSLYL